MADLCQLAIAMCNNERGTRIGTRRSDEFVHESTAGCSECSHRGLRAACRKRPIVRSPRRGAPKRLQQHGRRGRPGRALSGIEATASVRFLRATFASRCSIHSVVDRATLKPFKGRPRTTADLKYTLGIDELGCIFKFIPNIQEMASRLMFATMGSSSSSWL